MQRVIPYLAIVIVIMYGIYNTMMRTPKPSQTPVSSHYAKHTQQHHASHYADELVRVDTPEYIHRYIVTIINHGSHKLGFKSGAMEGGFAAPEDAAKIACHVLKLSGRKCPVPYPADAAMFYTSICGGCHGDDGKGLGGSFPDLTRKRLLGIEKRVEFLKEMVNRGK